MAARVAHGAGAHACAECNVAFDSADKLTKHKAKYCVGSAYDPVVLATAAAARGAAEGSSSPSHGQRLLPQNVTVETVAKSGMAKMSLQEVKQHFSSNVADLERLEQEALRRSEAEKVRKLRELKARKEQLRQKREQEEQGLLSTLKDLQAHKETELRLALEREQAKKQLKGLGRQQLAQLETEKRREIEALEKERDAALRREADAVHMLQRVSDRVGAAVGVNGGDMMRGDGAKGGAHVGVGDAKNRHAIFNQVQQHAEEHGRVFAGISEQTRRLQEQRNAIIRRLNELNPDGGEDERAEMHAREIAELVEQLRADSEKNELALQSLREQIERSREEEARTLAEENAYEAQAKAAGGRKGATTAMSRSSTVAQLDRSQHPKSHAAEKGALQPPQQPNNNAASGAPNSPRTEAASHFAAANPLVADIARLRADYLRQGGADPHVLAQMASLEMQARTAGAHVPTHYPGGPHPPYAPAVPGYPGAHHSFVDASSFYGLPPPVQPLPYAAYPAGPGRLPVVPGAFYAGGHPTAEEQALPSAIQKQLDSYEEENRRLQDEIDALLARSKRQQKAQQEQRTLEALAQRNGGRAGVPGTLSTQEALLRAGPPIVDPEMLPEGDPEVSKMRTDHAKRMLSLRHEYELLVQQSAVEALRGEQKRRAESDRLAQDSWTMRGGAPTSGFGPYDPAMGFVVYWDFATGMPAAVTHCALAFGLFDNGRVVGGVKALPKTDCFLLEAPGAAPQPPAGNNRLPLPPPAPARTCVCVFGGRRAFANVPPSPSACIVVEAQVPSKDGKLEALGWSKFELFDGMRQLRSGRWRLRLRVPPMQVQLHPSRVETLPPVAQAELCLRIVVAQGRAIHDTVSLDPISRPEYVPLDTSVGAMSLPQPPQPVMQPAVSMVREPTVASVAPQTQAQTASLTQSQVGQLGPRSKPPAAPSRKTATIVESESDEESEEDDESEEGDVAPSLGRSKAAGSIAASSRRGRGADDALGGVGIQIDRLRDAGDGPFRVRVSLLDANGEATADDNGMPHAFVTEPARSRLKAGIVEYGKQALFGPGASPPAYAVFEIIARVEGVETAVAWTATAIDPSETLPQPLSLDIYLPPLAALPDPNFHQRLGSAALIVWTFPPGAPPKGPAAPSTIGDSVADDLGERAGADGVAFGLPPEVFLPYSREYPPANAYEGDEGFDLYIDGARFLPDNVTITKVTGRVFDDAYNKIGPDLATAIELDSDMFNPAYNARFEYRAVPIPPTATILLKLYSIDLVTRDLALVGYSALNVFVNIGTEDQPGMRDTMPIALNTGAFQLRIYSGAPDQRQRLSVRTLEQNRVVPCATLLVRIVSAPKDDNGHALSTGNVPREDWESRGLFVPAPSYVEGKYVSTQCTPTRGEASLYLAVAARAPLAIRNALSLAGDGKEKRLRTDKTIQSWIKTRLSRPSTVQVVDMPVTYIAKYVPKQGISVSVDAATNLPKPRLSFAIFTLSPPGSFYHVGNRNQPKDSLTFTHALDFESELRTPVWKDGFRHFRRRLYAKFMVLIVDVRGVEIEEPGGFFSKGGDKRTFRLIEQGWSVAQVFTPNGYVFTESYQLPLYQGTPPESIIRQLREETVESVMAKAVETKRVKPIQGASVFVRIADHRRTGELARPRGHISRAYLPVGKEKQYQSVTSSKTATTAIPKDQSPPDFAHFIATKFEELATAWSASQASADA